MMPTEPLSWLTIGLLGLVTLTTRVAGVYLGRYVPTTPFWQRFLRHLPGTLLLAIALPAFQSQDFAQLGAAVVTLWIATRRINLVLVMIAGMATIAMLRIALPP